MEVLSVNLGKATSITWKGRSFRTAIVKEPIAGRVDVGLLGLTDDEHANSENHGGSFKALLTSPWEHYSEYWVPELAGDPLAPGSFGENLTTCGFQDHEVFVGDKHRIGTSLVAVTVPRKPCIKLNARHGRDDILRKYIESKRTNFYLTVLEPGSVAAGDPMALVQRHHAQVPPRSVVDLYLGHSTDPQLLERTLNIELLTDRARRLLSERLDHFTHHGEEEQHEF
jgi:MOSC domain-containing protein YiiM